MSLFSKATLLAGIGFLTTVASAQTSSLINSSTRGVAGSGSHTMISGFVVQAPAGQLRWLLIRGVGPSLSQFGVTGTLADPALRVFDRNGTVIAANDNFGSAPNLALLNTVTSAAGAFALGNANESAVLIGLPAGSYTAQLGAGQGTATGAVLLETYEFGSVGAGQQSQTITGIAASLSDFSTLTTALRLTGLDAALASGGPFTVFAPTDAAFAKLPAGTLNSLIANPAQLADVLRYHVVSGQVLSSQLANGQVAPTLLTGRSLTVTIAPGSVRVNTSNVTAADVRALNGVIHVIDTVLVPESVLGSDGRMSGPETPCWRHSHG
jgi:uncharacterized surface protein with fasciclin (FAS1) repeats